MVRFEQSDSHNRLNTHLSSLIVSSRCFYMPVELVARAKCVSDDSFESSSLGRLSSFGFSGTIAHGAFVPAEYYSMSGCSCAHAKPASQYRA